MTGADGADRSGRADRAGLRVRSCARHASELRCALRQATVINLLRWERAQSCVGELGGNTHLKGSTVCRAEGKPNLRGKDAIENGLLRQYFWK
jgi:hypothetical protein